MTDTVGPGKRSENMAKIRSKGSIAELTVRRVVHRMGYRYRLHRPDLPGKPDLVFPSRKKIVMVHGCFWHGHDEPRCKDGQRKPRSNLDYWIPKLSRNKQRDQQQEAELARLGWSVLIIWECEIGDQVALATRIKAFL